MFGLTAEQQRKKASMPPREAARYEALHRYWRARSIIFDKDKAMDEILDQSKIQSKKVRYAIKNRIKDCLDQFLKEYGGQIPEGPLKEKPI